MNIIEIPEASRVVYFESLDQVIFPMGSSFSVTDIQEKIWNFPEENTKHIMLTYYLRLIN